MATAKSSKGSKKSTVKKPAAKKISTRSKSAAVSASPAPKSSIVTTPASFKVKKLYIVFALIILLAAALISRYKGVFVAAVVNGQPISRVSVIKETEKQAGKQTIDNLIRNKLIEQEAKKKNITVSDKEIDAEIKKVEASLSKQGQKIDQVLAMQGLTKEDLRNLIRLDKLVSKLVGKDIKVTDQEVSAYIEQNRESLPQDQSEDQLKKTVTDNLRQQKLNEKVQKWLVELKAKAKVQYFVQY